MTYLYAQYPFAETPL
jgi:hypothetical protein